VKLETLSAPNGALIIKAADWAYRSTASKQESCMEQLTNSHPHDELLGQYLCGRLSTQEALEIETHCLTCARCGDRLAVLEWFPGARDGAFAILNPPVTIRSRSVPDTDPTAAPFLQRAFGSALTRFSLLTGSDQLIGATAVASAAILALSFALPITRAQQDSVNRAWESAVVPRMPAANASRAFQFGPPFDEALQLEADQARIKSIPNLRINYTRPVLLARVFIPPAQPVMLAHNDPLIPPASPRLHLELNPPPVPYEIPRLTPPRSSRFRSVLRVLAKPFVPERRERREQQTI
jgi:hypothetical protein